MPARKSEKVILYIVIFGQENLDSFFAQIGRKTRTLDRQFYSRSIPQTSPVDR